MRAWIVAAVGLAGCWTGAGAPATPSAPATGCATPLLGELRDGARRSVAGATVVLARAEGRLAATRSDFAGRFVLPAVAPPALLTIHGDDYVVEHALDRCESALVITAAPAPP